jgi:S-adenosylmethionine synthetase
MSRSTLFTSESVTEGHPDKVCDKISDRVLDEALRHDPLSRVACESAVTTQFALVMGEITTTAKLDIQRIAREVIADIGYTEEGIGFDARNVDINVRVGQQSPDIAQGVDARGSKEQGAGDQGIMFGYASNETRELMPLPISLAHQLTQRLTYMRKINALAYLRPDGKSQVTVQYGKDGRPERLDSVVLSAHHNASVQQKHLRADILRQVIKVVCAEYIDDQTKFHINPTGRFEVGGPTGDSGLTGRKIIVDTYGGMGRHGGGAFSGKDPSKVDRSAAYGARWAAKNIVAAGLAGKAEIQLGYAIGVASPVSINVETFGTGTVDTDVIEKAVRTVFDFRPAAMIERLNLRSPQYYDLAAYGHMGREDLNVAWEKTNKVEDLRRAARG